jgi:hypothetical protein
MRKMTFFAFASGKWPGFGASGFFFASSASKELKATLPRLVPRL